MMVSATAPPVHEPSSRQGQWLAAALMLAAAASIYLPVFAGLVRQWYEDADAAYGFLVAGAAAVAILQRWRRVRTIRVAGSWRGVAALIAATALYVVAALAADVFLLRLSFVALLAAAVWFVCGSAHVRLLAAPLALCVAAIPPPGALVTELTLPLQLGASHLATVILGLLGIDVVRDGNVLTLSYITLEVAEACSGMRSIVTLLALVAVYGGISGAAIGRVLLLAVATLPVALAGNGLRVAATAVLAARLGEDATRGVVHDATGFAAFTVMCAALAAVHVLASRYGRAAS
jgi:exosortase